MLTPVFPGCKVSQFTQFDVQVYDFELAKQLLKRFR